MNLILLLCFLQISNLQEDEFYRDLLKPFQNGTYLSNSLFILIQVEEKNNIYSSLIKCNDLYHYLENDCKIKKSEIYNFTFDILKNKKILKIKGNKTSFIFNKIYCNKEIENDFVKGRLFFVKKYIEGGYLKKENYKNKDDLYCLIAKLFLFKCTVHRDDETGYFFVKINNE